MNEIDHSKNSRYIGDNLELDPGGYSMQNVCRVWDQYTLGLGVRGSFGLARYGFRVQYHGYPPIFAWVDWIYWNTWQTSFAALEGRYQTCCLECLKDIY